jgi:hypothetical protein
MRVDFDCGVTRALHRRISRAWPLAARAQQPDRVRRIGVLMPFAACACSKLRKAESG